MVVSVWSIVRSVYSLPPFFIVHSRLRGCTASTCAVCTGVASLAGAPIGFRPRLRIAGCGVLLPGRSVVWSVYEFLCLLGFLSFCFSVSRSAFMFRVLAHLHKLINVLPARWNGPDRAPDSVEGSSFGGALTLQFSRCVIGLEMSFDQRGPFNPSPRWVQVWMCVHMRDHVEKYCKVC
jgi:hypothetical protein